MADRVVIEVLGPLRATVGDEEVALGGPRQRALLTFLVLHRDVPVPADRILDDLWGEDAHDGARRSLYTHLSGLRRVLGRHGTTGVDIVRDHAGYRLHAPYAQIDVAEFERHCDLASAGDTGSAAAAIDLWQGPPLPEVTDQPWARPFVAALAERYLEALLVHLDAELAAGRHAQLVGELAQLVEDHPLDERLWERHVLALYRTGRQADALAALRTVRQVLRDELGLDPGPGLADLEGRILRQEPAAAGAPVAPHVVPATFTSFVGRTSELDHLDRLLADNRLLTITGPGGVGKTRTAIELAHARRDAHPGGIWFVDLAPLHDGRTVAESVTRHVGLRCAPGDEITALAARLHDDAALFVLDNCEHLADDVAATAVALLRAVPQLRILVTSRVPLGIVGEVTWTLPPLEVPAEDDAPDRVAERDAARLLVERLRAVRPGFTLEAGNAVAVARLCRRLDGLPLALELAASRLRSMALSDLQAHLDGSIAVLRSPDPTVEDRHRTLSAVLQWSVDLLDADTRRVHTRLAVLPGTFDRSLAAAACGLAESRTADHLDALVTASLLTADTDGPAARYRMLEVVRDHAAELADDPRLPAEVGMALLSWCRDLVGRAAGPGEPGWIQRLITDEHNLRAALAVAADHDPAEGLKLATRLVRYWSAHLGEPDVEAGRDLPTIHEGIRWLSRLLEAGEADAPTRDRAVAALGFLRTLAGDAEHALPDLLDALDRMNARGEARPAAWTAYYAAIATWATGPSELAARRFRAAFDRFAAAGDPAGQALASLLEWVLGMTDGVAEGVEQARTRFLALTDRHPSRVLTFVRGCGFALEALTGGDEPRARARLREAHEYIDGTSDPVWTAAVASLTAWWSALADHHPIAAELLQAADVIEERSGIRWPITTAIHREARQAVGRLAPAGPRAPAAGRVDGDPAAPAAVSALLDRAHALLAG